MTLFLGNDIMDYCIFDAILSQLEMMLLWIRERFRTVSLRNGYEIELALEEALINIIRYAYNPQQTGWVALIFHFVARESLTCIIVDQGVAFNLFSYPQSIHLEAPLEQRREGGLGIFFILSIMDEVFYERRENHNILTLRKFLN